MSLLSIAAIFLVLCVIFVNGWTDAPTAIVSAVSSGALPYARAVRRAALCNLLGVAASWLTGNAVAGTLTEMVSFTGGSTQTALAALLSVMASIILFAVSAWYFGIPTSESHALIGALIGAALAVDPHTGVAYSVVGMVLLGLVGSVLLGLLLGRLLTRHASPIRRWDTHTLLRTQRTTMGLLAFFHGAQDGQKFLAVLTIVQMLAMGMPLYGSLQASAQLPTVLATAAVMGLGTLAGGRRIVETVGGKLVQVDLFEGICSDFAAILGLALATGTGLPVSTTHVKTASMVGASHQRASGQVLGSMAFTWLITLPVCAVLAYFLTICMLNFV